MMGKKDVGIAWFYNPQTETIEEYFSQKVLTELYGASPQKPKKRSK